MFTHLQVHSHYSLLEGIGKPQDYVNKAKEHGMEALALTDYNGMYGIIEFYQAAKKADIKPLVGVELHCVHDIKNKDPKAGGKILLLAENNDGYQALLELVSAANMEGYAQKPRIDFSLLKKYGNNLICCVGGEFSLIGQLVMQKASIGKQEDTIALLQEACGKDSVFAMVMAHNESKFQKVHRVNTAIKQVAEKIELPIVISHDVHYVNKDEQKPFEVALSIKDGKRIYDEDKRTVDIPGHLATEKEIVTTLEDNGYDKATIEKYLENTEKVVERCNCEISLNQLLFPKYEAPEYIQELYKKHKDGLIVKKGDE